MEYGQNLDRPLHNTQLMESKLDSLCKYYVNENGFSEYIVMYFLREMYPLSIPKRGYSDQLLHLI